jgi:DNA/RNA endonuclease YhcR with UshA esterase domain
MKTKILIALFAICCLSAYCYSEDTISSKDAKNFIGEPKIVRGIVASVFVSNKGTVLINFDEVHPNATFVAVIKPETTLDYSNIKKGVTLTVGGLIEEYNGKPEIVLTEQAQIIKVE